MIYIIKAEGTNNYKIGYTKDVGKRLKGLQTGCPNNLKIIDTFQGNCKREREIQEQFKQYKIRENGEWFEFTPKLAEKVLKKINDNCDKRKDAISDYYKDLILDKTNAYYIKDMVISSEKNEFYIQWEKKDGRTKRQKDNDRRRRTGRKISKEEYNERQRDWYVWRVRAKKVGVSQMIKNRPTEKEREEWKKEILELEHLGEKNGTSK